MNIDICRKCRHWNEFAFVHGKNDSNQYECRVEMRCEWNGEVKFWHRLAFPDGDIGIMRILERDSGTLFGVYYGMPLYRMALSCCGKNVDDSLLRNELMEYEPPIHCMYMAEHCLEEWNK